MKLFQSIGILTLLSGVLLQPLAYGHGGDGLQSLLGIFYGTEIAKEGQKNCSIRSDDGSILGYINNFFCIFEKKFGITGPTGEAGITNTLTLSSGSKVQVHVQVTGSSGGGAVLANGTTYDFEGKIWACLISSTATCASADQFVRMFYIAWSYKPNRTVNKGFMIHQFGVTTGSVGGAMKIEYDLGTSSAQQVLHALVYDHHDTSNIVRFRADSSKVGSVLSLTLMSKNESTSQATRVAAKVDFAAESGALYVESNVFGGQGVETLNSTASGDTGATPYCFTRAKSSDGVDYTYTLTTTASCTVPAFPAETMNQLAAETDTTVVTPTTGSEWNGMAARPSSV